MGGDASLEKDEQGSSPSCTAGEIRVWDIGQGGEEKGVRSDPKKLVKGEVESFVATLRTFVAFELHLYSFLESASMTFSCTVATVIEFKSFA